MAYAYVREIYDQAEVSKNLKIAVISDLHLMLKFIRDKKVIAGKTNIEIVASLLDFLAVDALIINGDIINDLRNLEDDFFRDELIELLMMLIRNVPTFYNKGNHDDMWLDEFGHWQKGDENALVEALKGIPNLTYLGGDCVGHSLMDSLGEDIIVAGLNMPFEFYEGQGEAVRVFREHFMNHFDEKLLHTVIERNSPYKILASHPAGKFAHLVLKDNDPHFRRRVMQLTEHGHIIESHTHNGFRRNGSTSESTYALLSPQKVPFAPYHRGDIEIEGDFRISVTPAISGRVEWEELGDRYFGGPGMVILYLEPKTPNKQKSRKKVRFARCYNPNSNVSSDDWIIR